MIVMTAPPVDVQPVYGDDSASDSGDEDGRPESAFVKAGASQESTDVKIMTWNIGTVSRGKSDCSFVLPEVLRQDVACLQEVTPAAVEWFHANLPKTYCVLTPVMRGHSWPQDGPRGGRVAELGRILKFGTFPGWARAPVQAVPGPQKRPRPIRGPISAAGNRSHLPPGLFRGTRNCWARPRGSAGGA